MIQVSSEQFVYSSCPICHSERHKVLFPDTLGNDAPSIGYQFGPDHFRTYRMLICRDCHHAYATPRPKSLSQYYMDVEDPAYVRHESQRIKTAERVVKKLKNYVKSGHLLDVGCATGDFLTVARKYYDVEGLELSDQACAGAKKKGLKIHQKSLKELQPEKLYDLITLWGVIEHFDLPDMEVKEIFRLVKSGGSVAIWTPDIRGLCAMILGKKWWHVQGQHLHLFSQKSLCMLLEQSGFKTLWVGAYPFVTTYYALGQSLNRYPFISKAFQSIVKALAIEKKSLTLYLPGEPFAIFQKK